MTPRRLLVIGSQCRSRNALRFLPEVAARLHALLVEPGPGGCVGVSLGDRPTGLLLDPTVQEVKHAIRSAINQAADAKAVLILAYIGHGEFPDERDGDFYLMPTDATEPTSDGAIHFAEVIKDRLKLRRDHAGLVVLLDACYAGAGVLQSMERWAQSLRGQIGFELLTATDDRATANAPLARAVIEILERGDPEADERIVCGDIHRLLQDRNRPAQHVAYNANDNRLHLGRNVAKDPGDVFWGDSPGRNQILEQTAYFQPTRQFAAVVEASRLHPVVVVTGEAGAGKSTLASALARPDRVGGVVPYGFARAVVLLNPSTNQRSLADDLERQLRRSVPGFAEAVATFEATVPAQERERLDFLRKKVLAPLDHLAGRPEIRIVLDAFDQIPDTTRATIGQALAGRPDDLRLVITAREGTPGCPPGHRLDVGRADPEALVPYLIARRVPEAARAAILDRAGDHWLIARLLADAVRGDPNIDLTTLPRTVEAAYARLLDQAGAADTWPDRFRSVLGLLAVAGPGPVLPMPLLVHAAGALDEGTVRDILAQLRGLIARRDPGTPAEHVGLFHPSLVNYLLGPSAPAAGYEIDAPEAHRAIDAVVPMSRDRSDDPLYRYAYLREADHCWALGDVEQTAARLPARESNRPRENLERWSIWLAQYREHLQDNQDHPNILDMRGWVASTTGRSGDAGGALRLFTELLPDRARVLGPDHPTRSRPGTI